MRTLFLTIFIFYATVSKAQQRIVTGVVKDESGELPGVLVQIKGTDISTETDFHGRFSVRITDNTNILVFKFLGYTEKEVLVKDKNHLNVKLNTSFECFLGANRLKLGISGGLNYTPKGLKIAIEEPYLLGLNGNPSAGYEYQTNSRGNSLHHFYIAYGIYYDFLNQYLTSKLSIKNFEISDLLWKFKEYTIINSMNLYTLLEINAVLNFGLGYSSKTHNDLRESNVGYSLGYRHTFRRLEPSIDISFWNSFWQYKVGLNYQYKRFHISYHYSSISVYKEHSLGLYYELFL